jgi:murein DD-endopeptidase MepM/ murein hydrolase activator NlpD
MGAENGAMTYNAQKFRLNRHLGDDLNGIGGGDSDLGDPVHAAGFGQVVFANDAGPGWGNMVILAHRIGPPDSRRVIQTVYAHLQDVSVQVGQVLQRGDCLGSVGNAGGRYLAHLHFEVREGPFVQAGVGYADSPLNRLDPQTILRELGPNPPDLLNPAPRAP